MKKILFTLVALMAVMTVQAQSICGSWRSVEPIVETEEDGSLTIQNILYTFNEDGTYSMVDEFTLSSEPAPTMALEIAAIVEFKGTYTLEGDQLTLTPNLDTYKAEILSLSMNGKVTDNPMVTNQVKSMLNSSDFKAQFGAAETNTIKVSDSTLEMSDGERTLTFVRFATIKN
jgi:hypothetical protein